MASRRVALLRGVRRPAAPQNRPAGRRAADADPRAARAPSVALRRRASHARRPLERVRSGAPRHRGRAGQRAGGRGHRRFAAGGSAVVGRRLRDDAPAVARRIDAGLDLLGPSEHALGRHPAARPRVRRGRAGRGGAGPGPGRGSQPVRARLGSRRGRLGAEADGVQRPRRLVGPLRGEPGTRIPAAGRRGRFRCGHPALGLRNAALGCGRRNGGRSGRDGIGRPDPGGRPRRAGDRLVGVVADHRPRRRRRCRRAGLRGRRLPARTRGCGGALRWRRPGRPQRGAPGSGAGPQRGSADRAGAHHLPDRRGRVSGGPRSVLPARQSGLCRPGRRSAAAAGHRSRRAHRGSPPPAPVGRRLLDLQRHSGSRCRLPGLHRLRAQLPPRPGGRLGRGRR